MKFMKNWNIAKKLMAAFLTIIVISSLGGISGLICMTHISSGYQKTLVENGFSQGDIGQALIMVSRIDTNVHDTVGYTNASDIQAAKSNVSKFNSLLGGYIEDVKKNCTSDAEQELAAKADSIYGKYYPLAKEIMDASVSADADAKMKLQMRLVDELTPLYEDLYETLEQIMEINSTIGEQNEKTLKTEATIVTIVVLVLMILSVGAGVFIATAISKDVAGAIKVCAKRLEKVAEGDLKSPVPQSKNNDETAILANATKTIVNTVYSMIRDVDYVLSEMGEGNFQVETKNEDIYVGDFEGILLATKRINRTLSATLSQINQAADQVASGADQVSNGAQALSQGSTEQAASVEELSATITEMTNNIKKNADDAKNANSISMEAADGVIQSNDKMNQMVEAMNEISEKSAEISKIIKAIDDIAFQTNILALNAAVEAARAGAAGKGFSVVADEVRNLSQKSTEAAKTTSDLIDATVKAVERGSKLVDETAEALNTVVKKSKVVSDTVVDIATASEMQATAAMQIHTGIDQIAAVVQTNSATAQESAAASEEFNGQAQTLKNLISRFKLRPDEVYFEDFGDDEDEVDDWQPSLEIPEDDIYATPVEDDVVEDTTDAVEEEAVKELLEPTFTVDDSDKY